MTAKNIPQSLMLHVAVVGLVLPILGCGGMKLVPVSGQATLNGKPLTGVGVSFMADTSRGNHAHVACIGRTGTDGEYEIKTAGVEASQTGKGAPPGWYKVIFFTPRGAPEIRVHPKYLDPDTSPLAVEVVANPAADQYDLKLVE